VVYRIDPGEQGPAILDYFVDLFNCDGQTWKLNLVKLQQSLLSSSNSSLVLTVLVENIIYPLLTNSFFLSTTLVLLVLDLVNQLKEEELHTVLNLITVDVKIKVKCGRKLSADFGLKWYSSVPLQLSILIC